MIAVSTTGEAMLFLGSKECRAIGTAACVSIDGMMPSVRLFMRRCNLNFKVFDANAYPVLISISGHSPVDSTGFANLLPEKFPAISAASKPLCQAVPAVKLLLRPA